MNTPTTISVNRAPVLTLWAAIVAERLGFDRAAALTLGRAVAGLNAQSKGVRLGVFKPREDSPDRDRGTVLVEVCGRPVPAVESADGVRAVEKGRPVDPGGVERYLGRAFGDALPAVRAALAAVAKSYPKAELGRAAYPLYERFRPAVPEGRTGWGAKGVLDLGRLDQLKRKPRTAAKRAVRKVAKQ